MKGYTVTGNKVSWISLSWLIIRVCRFYDCLSRRKREIKSLEINSKYFTERNIIEMKVNSHEKFLRRKASETQ
jgi:hypothetical protein